MLYTSGMLRKIGRVDHGDAFLDTHAIEKKTRHNHILKAGRTQL
ncbi:MAG: hypothetical protein SPK73_04240 [Eubacteriales bacterium]|nr:hypothetical protein [Eubacteriales bacterium]